MLVMCLLGKANFAVLISKEISFFFVASLLRKRTADGTIRILFLYCIVFYFFTCISVTHISL